MYCSTNPTPTFLVHKSLGFFELLLQPQDVHLDVPDLVQAAALRDADGGGSVHADADLGLGHAKVREECRYT